MEIIGKKTTLSFVENEDIEVMYKLIENLLRFLNLWLFRLSLVY